MVLYIGVDSGFGCDGQVMSWPGVTDTARAYSPNLQAQMTTSSVGLNRAGMSRVLETPVGRGAVIRVTRSAIGSSGLATVSIRRYPCLGVRSYDYHDGTCQQCGVGPKDA